MKLLNKLHEPLNTLRRMELEILSDIHQKTRVWMGVEDSKDSEYLLAHIKALDTAYDIVQAERKRHEKKPQPNETLISKLQRAQSVR